MIDRFKMYLRRKGYALEFATNFHEDMHGVSCVLGPVDYPKDLKAHFTQVFNTTEANYNVRLNKVDFDNELITGGLF